MGLFRRDKPLATQSARQLATTLHDAGWTDLQIADAIGASRAHITKVRNGAHSGTLLRPRLLELLEDASPVPDAEPQPSRPARPVRQARPPYVQKRPSPAPQLPKLAQLPNYGTLSPHDIGQPISIARHQFGWVGQDGRPTKQPPEPPQPAEQSRAVQVAAARETPQNESTGRALLQQGYSAMRDAGLSDALAQAILSPFRQLAQRAARPAHPPREAAYTRFLAQAEQELRTGRNAGVWQTGDVIERAKELARAAALNRQPARLPDREPRMLVAAQPRPAPTAVRRTPQLAWPRHRIAAALGDTQAAAREEAAQQIRSLVTDALRRAMPPTPPETPDDEPTQSVVTDWAPPTLGMPAGLGAPIEAPTKTSAGWTRRTKRGAIFLSNQPQRGTRTSA